MINCSDDAIYCTRDGHKIIESRVSKEEAVEIVKNFNGSMFKGVLSDKNLILIASQIKILQQ